MTTGNIKRVVRIRVKYRFQGGHLRVRESQSRPDS
jgi:hypothetical protein